MPAGLQDLDTALDRVRKGEPIESVLKPPVPVASHVLDDDMDSSGDDMDDDVTAEPNDDKGHKSSPPHRVEL